MDDPKTREKISRATSTHNKIRWEDTKYRHHIIEGLKGNQNGKGNHKSKGSNPQKSDIKKAQWADPNSAYNTKSYRDNKRGTNNPSYGKGKLASHADEIIALRENGWTYQAIADKFGSTPGPIRRLIDFRK